MRLIEFNRVSKAYRLGMGQTTLREALARQAQRLMRRHGLAHDQHLFWALNEVSFQVEQGEIVGIIGHNGAGKSTILKLLSRVTFPTRGQITTRGRMAALIELGAGFHPDLTGRENIYLNGIIMGLKRREIDAQFANIVEFAGLEQFIDTPVKRYSSGMYLRLAFAVAAHVHADLILVDEVLSVGDAAFQQRCLTKMHQLHRDGATIVFVSHNLWSVSTFCTRALLLRGGQIQADGHPVEVIQMYRQQDREAALSRLRNQLADSATGSGTEDDAQSIGFVVKSELLNAWEQPEQAFGPDEALMLRISYVAPQPLETPAFVVQIRRADGVVCCFLKSPADEMRQGIYGEGSVVLWIDPLQLAPDMYMIEVRLEDHRRALVYATDTSGIFYVKGYLHGAEVAGVFQPHVRWSHSSHASHSLSAGPHALGEEQ
ncbi:MAG: polysaccharide ABC transporter ATP-binding protein [Oscillochloridaceae bacterium]|nr:polysaccharide ABC transporter ATP-binding protein [Chloroflexaceae bacterium]MDW8389818.1 polysaccharide ABC transporter ATP-binding protein [Oscillochloridaceae bacterium]